MYLYLFTMAHSLKFNVGLVGALKLLSYSRTSTNSRLRLLTSSQNLNTRLNRPQYCILSNSHGRKFFTNSVCAKYHQEDDDINDDADEEREHQSLVNRMFRAPMAGHRVLVLQPYVKWGASKRVNTTPQLQLDEAAALIRSLSGWTVEDKIMVPLRNLDKKKLFGMGNLETLKEKVRCNKQITAVFISVELLQAHQHKELEAVFRVPVYDRYMIVIQIFRMHAMTKEAKLQVAMAEIPFLWSRLKEVPSGTIARARGAGETVGGTGESHGEVRKRLLLEREMKIKRKLLKLRGQRELLRKNRQKQSYPVVAVVGYTNAGKTSLIKALTGDKNLHPRNELFATLDVTNHGGLLPCQLKVLFVDTLGFISDIPTSLIESFVATLEDAMLADVILHVRDISHPDTKAQDDHVKATLQRFNLGNRVMDNIVVAGNKMDLVASPETEEHSGVLPVSALHHTGIDTLRHELEKAILLATNRVLMIIRVPMGGDEASWLYKNVAVTNVTVDPKDSQYMLMKVVISESEVSKFRHRFI